MNDKDENVIVELIKIIKPEEIIYFINNENILVKKAIAQYGTDKQRDIILNQNNHSDWVLFDIAYYGNDNHRNILISSKSEIVLSAIACKGNETQRKILVNSENQYIKKIAEKETEEEREIELTNFIYDKYDHLEL